jgi:hypothetical protein
MISTCKTTRSVSAASTWGWAAAAVLVVGIGVGGANCGGGSSTPLTDDGFCQQKAAKECLVTAKCGSSMNACLAQRLGTCGTFVRASKTGPRVLKEGNVAACINKTATVYGLAAIKQTDLDDMNDVCSYVYQGSSKTTCTVKYDCADKNAICDTKNGNSLCATKVTKKLNDPCGNGGEICATGSYCTMDATRSGAYYCLARGAAGTACDGATPCLESLHCDATANTCMARLDANQTCVSSDDCAPGASYCDPYIGNKCDVGLIFAPTAVAACADYGGTTASGGTGGSTGSSDAAVD